MRACAAIVAMADLMLGDAVASVLEAHLRAAGGRLRGIRNSTAWHASEEVRSNPVTPPPGLLMEPAFRRGVGRLGGFGLLLDVRASTQLGEVVDLARALPGVTVVLDHCGGPLGVGPFAKAARRGVPGLARRHANPGRLLECRRQARRARHARRRPRF
jgi:predicted TIM-barrel fold metal-dependent hydrolase